MVATMRISKITVSNNQPAIDVVIATIPPRLDFLDRAVNSVLAQTFKPRNIIVVHDDDRIGAARTRNLALNHCENPDYIAYLDDDDYFYPNHLKTHLSLKADFTYSWFDGNNPFPQHRGRPFDKEDPHHTTMTVMVSRKLHHLRFRTDHPEGWTLPQEDWRYIKDCCAVPDVTFKGTPEITWHYSNHGKNTCGRPVW